MIAQELLSAEVFVEHQVQMVLVKITTGMYII